MNISKKIIKYSFYISLFHLLCTILFIIFPKNDKYKFINSSIDLKSVLILEFNPYHFECLPGYTKYFIDLGYNVDIIMRKNFKESMEKFEPKNKIRIFEFKTLTKKDKNIETYRKKLKKYDYLFLQTTDKKDSEMYKLLGYYDNPNSLFVVHGLNLIDELNITNFTLKNHTFSLADYNIVTYLNPNYFGEFNLTHEKNNLKNKTSFLIVSTPLKNYSFFIEAIKNLYNKSIDFEVHVPGHVRVLNESLVPQYLRKKFHFYGYVNYQKLYKIVMKSDYIIMNLFPTFEDDNLFRTYKATGNAQLIYGFYKPAIIEENFAPIYKFTNESSIIFKDFNISSAIEKATMISNEEYKEMSKKIKLLREKIYNISLKNLKMALNSH